MTQTPTRSDARENRRRLLDAAREAFAESPEASLNRVAKIAGVGPGTLYRHFPTREDLVLAVYRDELEQLVALAPALLAAHPPLAALRLWFARLAAGGQMKSGVAAIVHSESGEGIAREAYGPVVGAIRQLVVACADEGSLRSDLDPDDVLLLLGFLWRIDPASGGGERAERLLGLVMDGLRPR